MNKKADFGKPGPFMGNPISNAQLLVAKYLEGYDKDTEGFKFKCFAPRPKLRASQPLAVRSALNLSRCCAPGWRRLRR